MSDDVQLQRDIGRMEGDISALRKDMGEMKIDARDDMSELKADVKAMRASFDQLKGGTRTLLGVAAVIGALVSWGLHYFFGRLP